MSARALVRSALQWAEVHGQLSGWVVGPCCWETVLAGGRHFCHTRGRGGRGLNAGICLGLLKPCMYPVCFGMLAHIGKYTVCMHYVLHSLEQLLYCCKHRCSSSIFQSSLITLHTTISVPTFQHKSGLLVASGICRGTSAEGVTPIIMGMFVAGIMIKEGVTLLRRLMSRRSSNSSTQ